MGTDTTGTPNPFLDVDNWQGVDDEPTAGSNGLVKSGGIYGTSVATLGYYECSTGASTVAKVVPAAGYILTVGGNIKIKFANVNTAESPTLNINSTGAKPLYYGGALASADNTWYAGEVCEVYYDGTNFNATTMIGARAEDVFFHNDTTDTLVRMAYEGIPKLAEGVVNGKLNVVAGRSHSGTIDRVRVFIPKGVEFTVAISNDTGTVNTGNSSAVWAAYGEDTTPVNVGNFGSTTPLHAVATNDITSIGVYVSGSYITQSGDLKLNVTYGFVGSAFNIFQIPYLNTSLYFNNGGYPTFVRSINIDRPTGSANLTPMSLSVTLSGTFRIIGHNGNVIVGPISTYNNQTFTLNNYQCLVWNLTSSILEVVSYPLSNDNTYIPILGLYGTSVFGIMKPFYDRWAEKEMLNVFDTSLYFLNGLKPDFAVTISTDTIPLATVSVTITTKFRILDHKGALLTGDIDLRNNSYTITNYQCLVWNWATSTLEVITYPTAITQSDNYIPLLGVYGTAVFGIMKPFYDEWVLNNTEGKIGLVDAKIGALQPELVNIVLGTIYHGEINITANKDCLASDVFVPVIPNSSLIIQRANDLLVRVTEYDSEKTYVSDSGSYAAIDSYVLGGTATYVRISALYSARGYSASNPITVNDYTTGDFGIILNISDKLKTIGEQQFDDITITGKNRDKIERIKAASKTYVSGADDTEMPKNYMFVIATDIHNNIKCLENAIDLADNVSQIDAVMNLGDQQKGVYDASALPTIQAAVTYGTKPKFIVLGNHDVGNSKKVRYTCDHLQAYTAYIKPMIDAGYLANGEYQVGKSYYYHDLATQKLRLIFLNNYDETIELADSIYWEPIAYDSTKPLMTDNTNYVVGDIVNCGVYTAHSFRCISSCTSGTSSNASSMQEPLYKMLRGRGAIQHDQAQWLLDTLLSTPQDYSIIIASHSVFSQNVTAMTSAKFCQNVPFPVSMAQDLMTTDLIAAAVDAYMQGSNFSINVAFSGEGAYMNTESGGAYAYTVAKDFSAKNSGVKFIGYINGHFHQDIIWQHNTYSSQKSVCPTTSSPTAGALKNSDIQRVNAAEDVNYDALTVVGVDTLNAKLCLARIGADISTDMYMRDVEKI